MAKFWSATSLVALGLLSCLGGTRAEDPLGHKVVHWDAKEATWGQYSHLYTNHEKQQDPHPKPAWDHTSKDPQVPQSAIPAQPQKLPIYRPDAIQHPQPPPPQRCDVEDSVRVPCGAPDISAAECEAISCCFSGRSCYFGRTVTVQCTKDAHFIVVVAKDTTLPNVDLETISLLGEGPKCTCVDSNSAFAIYYFPVTACGSVVMEEANALVYENRMISSYEVGFGPLGAITRDSHYQLLFQCRYIASSFEAMVVEVLNPFTPVIPVAAQGPIRVHMRLANGQCYTKGCNELDVVYSSFYTETDYPVTKVLRQPVYVDVTLFEKTDPKLVLTLDHCWATAGSNPHSLPQWDLLVDGCPHRDDRYMTRLVPVPTHSPLLYPSHHKRFFFKMFTFVNPTSLEPMNEMVYIHCSTAVCVSGQVYSCEPSCYRNKRSAQGQFKAEKKTVVSSGPVIITATEQ